MPDSQVRHTLSIEGFHPELRLLEFEGSEGLSELFRFEVLVVCDEPIPFEDVIGKRVHLNMQVGEEDEARPVHGIVVRIEQAASAYRITLVPKVWRLTQRVDSRIFQELTAPQVIEKVLQAAGLESGTDYRLSLNGSYAQREYCVQYRESDWDFACRLMEAEGICHYFEQLDDHATLVLGDGPHAHDPIPGDTSLLFRPSQGSLGSSERGAHVSRFQVARELRPGKVSLRDYDFKKPKLSLEAMQEGDSERDVEVYDYPGVYELPAQGERFAGLRLAELHASAAHGEGDSTATRLSPGHVLTLDEHPHDRLNIKYLLTRVEHRGVVPGAREDDELQTPYANRFEVIPAAVTFRPLRVTPKPAIQGVQTAIVVGPSGEEIYTDEHGRIKVQFFWDRQGKNDQKSSCWMRVSQSWAGPGWGAVFIPRIGHEVVVTFLEGNPDRPLVIGSVYHGTNVPPYALPGERTKSTLKSKTVSRDEGFNELRFEDKSGSEEVYLHAQKDSTIVVEHDKNQTIGHDETLTVKHDRKKDIQHDQSETVGNDDVQTVKHDRTVEVDNDEQLTVKHDRTVSVSNDHVEKVDGKQTITIGKDQKTSVTGKHSLTVDDAQDISVAQDATHAYKGALTRSVDKEQQETIKGKASLKVEQAMTVSISEAYELSAKSAKQTLSTSYELSAGDGIDIKCGAVTVSVKSDGSISIEGASLALKCTTGKVSVEGVNVEIKAQASAKLEATGSVTVKASGPIELNGAMIKLGGQLVNLG